MPRPPRSFRTEAIILKRRDLGEADRLLALLTPDYGKLDVIAKGARKPTSSKTGHVELFTRAEVLVAKGRSLDILVQAEMREPFLALRQNLTKGAYASYAVELLDRFTVGFEENMQDLFILLDHTLTRLCNEDDVQRIIRYYELRLLDIVGFRPALSECVVSQEIILPEDQFFSFDEGGVVTPEAAATRAGLVPISMNTLKILRHMQRSTYARVGSLNISEERHAELERIMLGYIRHILENKVQSVAFIQRIRRFPKD